MELSATDRKIIELISRKIAYGLTDCEEMALGEWRKSSAHNEELYVRLTDPDHLTGYERKLAKIDTNRYWQSIESRIRPRRMIRMRWVAAAVAMVVVAVGSTLIWQTGFYKHQEEMVIAEKEEIHPGTQKATLVLAGGQQVDLGEMKGKTMDVDGIEVSGERAVVKEDAGASGEGTSWNKIITPRGGEYNLVLNDGTVVYINSESQLEFPAKFNGKQRVVRLRGEAYFQVAKAEKRPFIVETEGMDVRVTGTEFNVKAYPDERLVQTTLVNGKVNIAAGNGKQQCCELYPSQQAELNLSGNNLSVKEVDISSYIAWKNGQFVFKGTRLEEIMATLARWYDFEVSYSDESIKDLVFAGRLNRMESVTPILDIMRLTQKVHIEVKGKIIILSAK